MIVIFRIDPPTSPSSQKTGPTTPGGCARFYQHLGGARRRRLQLLYRALPSGGPHAIRALLAELRRIGYSDLEIRARATEAMHARRRAGAAALR